MWNENISSIITTLHNLNHCFIPLINVINNSNTAENSCKFHQNVSIFTIISDVSNLGWFFPTSWVSQCLPSGDSSSVDIVVWYFHSSTSRGKFSICATHLCYLCEMVQPRMEVIPVRCRNLHDLISESSAESPLVSRNCNSPKSASFCFCPMVPHMSYMTMVAEGIFTTMCFDELVVVCIVTAQLMVLPLKLNVFHSSWILHLPLPMIILH